MYNEAQKWSFIHDYTSGEGVAKACVVLFNMIEPLETELALDVCQIKDAYIIRDFLGNKVGMRSRSIAVRLSTLRAYCWWCVENDVVDAKPALLDVKITASDRLKETRIGTPGQLQKFLDAVFDKESELTYDNVMRSYCWLGFMGVPEESVEDILSDDVDRKNWRVTVDGKEYGMYFASDDDGFIYNSSECLENCKEMNAFKYYHPLYNNVIWRRRVDGKQLLRGIKSGPRCERLREKLYRANGKALEEGHTQLRLTYKRIWLCGLFYETYQKEEQGETIDFNKIADKILENEGKKSDENYKSRIAHTAADFKRDYTSWKELYGY